MGYMYKDNDYFNYRMHPIQERQHLLKSIMQTIYSLKTNMKSILIETTNYKQTKVMFRWLI